jgi:hypothetical protein
MATGPRSPDQEGFARLMEAQPLPPSTSGSLPRLIDRSPALAAPCIHVGRLVPYAPVLSRVRLPKSLIHTPRHVKVYTPISPYDPTIQHAS